MFVPAFLVSFLFGELAHHLPHAQETQAPTGQGPQASTLRATLGLQRSSGGTEQSQVARLVQAGSRGCRTQGPGALVLLPADPWTQPSALIEYKLPWSKVWKNLLYGQTSPANLVTINNPTHRPTEPPERSADARIRGPHVLLQLAQTRPQAQRRT